MVMVCNFFLLETVITMKSSRFYLTILTNLCETLDA